jgi:RHS repeat-associated protein
VRNNASGSGSNAYYPWGEERLATSEDTFKFATYFRDGVVGTPPASVMQDYANARYYNSNFGRFWSADPMGHANPRDPQSWNQYAYAGGDPVNSADPSGRQCEAADPSADCLGEVAVQETGGRGGGASFCWTVYSGEYIGNAESCFGTMFNYPSTGTSTASTGSSSGGSGWPVWVMNSPVPTAAQIASLQAAFNDAMQRLQNPDCMGLFETTTGPPELNQGANQWAAFAVFGTLQSTEYQIVAFGSSGSGAQTLSPTWVQVNSQGAMFATPNAQGQLYISVPNPTTGVPTQLATPLSTADVGAFILLHELGHQVGVFGADADSPAVNGQHSWDVLENCFGMQPPQ